MYKQKEGRERERETDRQRLREISRNPPKGPQCLFRTSGKSSNGKLSITAARACDAEAEGVI